MEKYTIYCTKGQTKKALELGASIEHSSICYEGYDIIGYSKDYVSQVYGIIPTAEQMLGWLRSQGFRFRIKDLEESTHWEVTMDGWIADGELSTPKEAILAAIDAALDYLIRNKK